VWGGVGVAVLGEGRVLLGWVCCNMMGVGNASTVHYMIDGALLADFPTIFHRKKLAQIHRLGTLLLVYSYRFSSPILPCRHVLQYNISECFNHRLNMELDLQS
jgi:hypothetical protein